MHYLVGDLPSPQLPWQPTDPVPPTVPPGATPAPTGIVGSPDCRCRMPTSELGKSRASRHEQSRLYPAFIAHLDADEQCWAQCNERDHHEVDTALASFRGA